MRLFWKVFTALILTLLLTAAASTWLSQTWIQSTSEEKTQIDALAGLGQTAVSMYEMGGRSGYRRWLHQTTRTHHFRGGLMDAQGHHILPRPLPQQLQRLLKRAIREQQTKRIIRPPVLAVAAPIAGESTQYFWVASTLTPPEQMRSNRQNMLMLRIAIMLLAMTLVSWLLTRMITRPIRLLQQTTEQLGQGSLSQRTPKHLSGRRDELGDLARSFDNMAIQIESLLHSHKQLLRDISHELRSPLARLQIALELARDETGDAAISELDRIGIEADRLNALISEVLTLARFEQGNIDTDMTSLQLDKLVVEVAEDAAFEATVTGKSVNYSDLCECHILADRLWVKRALDNVIRNAVRHTANNSQVRISMTSNEYNAEIRIRDHGNGVNEAQIPHLFETFFRASEARESTTDSGYGLGLAIAKRAVELHHGHIQAMNHPEGGLEVVIRLPLCGTSPESIT